jgi:hypothetical protein
MKKEEIRAKLRLEYESVALTFAQIEKGLTLESTPECILGL